MTDRRPSMPLDSDPSERVDPRGEYRDWAPIVLDEERRGRLRLANEMRPLLDSLERLRDRGLLE